MRAPPRAPEPRQEPGADRSMADTLPDWAAAGEAEGFNSTWLQWRDTGLRRARRERLCVGGSKTSLSGG